MQKELTLKLTMDEINLILEALGKRPYEKVYPIIPKIHKQATEQLHPENGVELKEKPLATTSKS